MGYPVFLTDGLTFIFYEPNQEAKVVNLGQVDRRKISVEANSEGRISELFRRLFDKPKLRKVTEQKLIKEVAERARELSKDIADLTVLTTDEAIDDAEFAAIKSLKDLQSVLQEHHDEDLKTIKTFSDFVAQILLFGLYYAYRLSCMNETEPAIRHKRMREFWMGGAPEKLDDRLRPMRALIKTLDSQLHDLNKVGLWYDDCLALLAHTNLSDASKIIDYHGLYELFLSEFSPQVRFDYGAFYTPHELADYSLAFVELLVKKTNPNIQIFSEGNKLIDPCCGTGTFLELLVNRAKEHGGLPTIAGFEILPAPYALANYRIGMLNLDKLSSRIEIILTNTLSDALEKVDVEGGGLVGDEQRAARRLAKPPLTLIIGNPPSSDSARGNISNFQIIMKALEDFRPPKEERTARSNVQKQLSNPFVAFVRWACLKLNHKNPSVLSFILPEALIETPSYKSVRTWLVDFFDQIWILKVDADLRTGERSENIFNTQQGRALFVGLRNITSEDKRSVFFKDISTKTLREKRMDLSVNSLRSNGIPEFERTDTINWQMPIKSKEGTKNKYSNFLPVTASRGELGFFLRHCSGIKLAPSSIVVHADNNILRRRCRELGNSEVSLSETAKKWFQGQKRPVAKAKFTERVRQALADIGKDPSEIKKYTYRPFVQCYAGLSDSLLEALLQAPGKGTRDRPEIRAAFSKKNNFGIAIAPSPKQLGTLHKFSSFCWSYPDNDMASRGNAHIFCPIFPEYGASSLQPNIHPDILNKFALKEKNLDALLKTMTFYVYAWLSSPAFLEAYKAELHTVGQWPKIPLIDDWVLVRTIAELGRNIAELENFDIETDKQEEIKDFRPFQLTKVSLDSKGNVSFYSNSVRTMSISVDPEVAAIKVAGYHVVKEWLKYRTWPYYRKNFSVSELAEFLEVVARLRTQNLLYKKLDVIVHNTLSTRI